MGPASASDPAQLLGALGGAPRCCAGLAAHAAPARPRAGRRLAAHGLPPRAGRRLAAHMARSRLRRGSNPLSKMRFVDLVIHEFIVPKNPYKNAEQGF